MSETNDTTTLLQARLHRLEADVRRHDAAGQRARWVSRAAVTLGVLVVPAVAIAVDIPYAFQAGDPVVAAELNENFAALASAIEESVIREDTTIQINPIQTCAAIQQALDDLDARQVVGAATVTIELLPGTYACDASLVVRHFAGDRIHIVGAGNAAEDVVLTFPAATYGVIVRPGRSLGALSNLTLDGDLGPANGLDVGAGGSAWVSDIVVREFANGLHASRGGVIQGTGVLTTANEGAGATAWIEGTVILDASSAMDNGWVGFVAHFGATMYLTNCTSEGNLAGFAAFRGSLLDVGDSAALANAHAGFQVAHNSTLVAHDVTASGNVTYGYEALHGGYLGRYGTLAGSGNGAETNIAPHAPNPTDGAVISD